MKLLNKMHKYKTMLSYCLKCKKKKKKPKSKQYFYQNVLYAILKNQNLLKNKKQVNHLVV